MTTDPTPTPDSAPENAAPAAFTFTTAYAVVCPEAGLYCEGTATAPDGRTGTWRLPVIAFDMEGRPLVAAVGSVAGRLVPAAVYDPAYRLEARTHVVAGTDAPVEYVDRDGIRRIGTVSAWGIDLDGTVQPLHVTDRAPVARHIERDADGRITGVTEE